MVNLKHRKLVFYISTQGKISWQARRESFGRTHILNRQNWHCDYDPSIGRYIQADPLDIEAGINVYAYVGNNPLVYADPMGLFLVSNHDKIAECKSKCSANTIKCLKATATTLTCAALGPVAAAASISMPPLGAAIIIGCTIIAAGIDLPICLLDLHNCADLCYYIYPDPCL